MGMWRTFTCRACDDAAQVSGDRDSGMIAVTRTMYCRHCRELVDVLVGRHGREGPTGDAEYDRDLDRCPKCEGRDLAPWTAGESCPRCGGAMDREKGDFVIWD